MGYGRAAARTLANVGSDSTHTGALGEQPRTRKGPAAQLALSTPHLDSLGFVGDYGRCQGKKNLPQQLNTLVRSHSDGNCGRLNIPKISRS